MIAPKAVPKMLSNVLSALKGREKGKGDRVFIIGTQGAGKSSLIAGLAILGDAAGDSRITVNPVDKDSSIYVNDLSHTLRNGEWPKPSSRTELCVIDVDFDGRSFELMLLDYPGEEFRKAMMEMDEDNFDQLFQHMRNADYHFILIDPETCRHGAKSGDTDMSERINALFKAINDVARERARSEEGGKKEHSIAGGVILTKADSIPELKSMTPVEFFRKHQPNLDRRLREKFWKTGYLAISATGECLESRTEDGKIRYVPNRNALKPDGYEDLFGWMIETDRRKRRFVLGSAAAVVAVILLALFFANSQNTKMAEARYAANLANSNLSVVQKLEGTRRASFAENVTRRNDVFTGELKAIADEAIASRQVVQIDGLLERLNSLQGVTPHSQEGLLSITRAQLDERWQEMSLRLIEDAFNGKKPEFPILADVHLKKYSIGSKADRVRELLRIKGEEEINSERRKIAALRADDASQISDKAQAINDFLDKFGQAPQLTDFDRQRMRRAAELGRRFSSRDTYEVIIKRSGGMTTARYQGIDILVGNSTNPVSTLVSPGRLIEVTWDSVTRIDWTASEQIRIVLTAADKYNPLDSSMKPIASIRDQSPIALRAFNGSQIFTNVATDWQSEVNGPFVVCEVKGITPDDWQAVADYIFPGDKW